ncbi:hypothetical protein Acor_07740 [Acrocarpospora corrugata]|uniref:Uncharacterized protein n=1 Tax=Acrocarpospora corrugata TaxID=35763 RepID=A0A5M3VSW0_9ACTN|nr:DUF6000 family protein [Acrocarpospora corrugata]GER98711.1 hypothetical protein Acor_07740 [Acrocarpospora corrugata]
MTFRLPQTDDELALVRRYVVWSQPPPGRGRYMKLRGVNPLREESDRDVFNAALAEDARRISDADLDILLGFEWRARLTAAWLIGLDVRTQFREALGELLLASELVYSGQGYCLALARFGRPEDAEILTAYLDRYLPQTDCHYDQDWAIGALLHLDAKLGTAHAQRFLGPEGLWHRSAFAGRDPLAAQRRTEQLCLFAERVLATIT